MEPKQALSISANGRCDFFQNNQLLINTYQLPVPGWSLAASQPMPAASAKVDHQAALYEAGTSDGQLVISCTAADSPDPAGNNASQATVRSVLDDRAGTFVKTVSWGEPQICTFNVGDQPVEFCYMDLVNQNAAGQQYKGRAAVRVLDNVMFVIVYADKLENWSDQVWGALQQSLVLPGAIVPSAAVPAAGDQMPFMSNQQVGQILQSQPPLQPAPTVAAAVPTAPAIVPSSPIPMGSPVPPAPAPGNGAVPPLPPGFIPTKPKNPLKPLYIIGGVIGGLLLISFVIFGVSDFQAQLANVKKTSPSSSPGLSLSGTQIKVALGKSANIDGLEMKVEKITENYQGETSKLYPGNAENYVHVVYSVKNTTSSSLTLSEINVQSVVNGRVMIPDYNPEPSDLSKDATIQPGATATYSMNILLTTSDSLSNAKFAYQLQKKIYIFDLN